MFKLLLLGLLKPPGEQALGRHPGVAHLHQAAVPAADSMDPCMHMLCTCLICPCSKQTCEACAHGRRRLRAVPSQPQLHTMGCTRLPLFALEFQRRDADTETWRHEQTNIHNKT